MCFYASLLESLYHTGHICDIYIFVISYDCYELPCSSQNLNQARMLCYPNSPLVQSKPIYQKNHFCNFILSNVSHFKNLILTQLLLLREAINIRQVEKLRTFSVPPSPSPPPHLQTLEGFFLKPITSNS